MTKAVLLLLVGLGACHRHHDEAPEQQQQTAAASADSSVVAAPAPSESVAAAPSASAPSSATPAMVDDSAREMGMLALLQGNGDAAAPLARPHPLSTKDLFGGDRTNLDETFGSGGLGLGAGERPAGSFGGGVIGTGRGPRDPGGGEGFGSGRLGGTSGVRANVARVRYGATTVNGRLPPEVVRRIVRRNFGRFRNCYDQGLQKNAKLAGNVVTKFVIDEKGAVSSAASEPSTTMPDASVVSCVTHTFSTLSYPAPEGGVVVVVLPLLFDLAPPP